LITHEHDTISVTGQGRFESVDDALRVCEVRERRRPGVVDEMDVAWTLDFYAGVTHLEGSYRNGSNGIKGVASLIRGGDQMIDSVSARDDRRLHPAVPNDLVVEVDIAASDLREA